MQYYYVIILKLARKETKCKNKKKKKMQIKGTNYRTIRWEGDSYKLRTLFSRTIKKREGKGGRRGATIVTG